MRFNWSLDITHCCSGFPSESFNFFSFLRGRELWAPNTSWAFVFQMLLPLYSTSGLSSSAENHGSRVQAVWGQGRGEFWCVSCVVSLPWIRCDSS